MNDQDSTKIEIRQIFYDDESLMKIQSPFMPLDNRYGDKSWFEFFPILNFLRNTELEDNVFYGFLSPKFSLKTGLSPVDAIAMVRKKIDKDVVLFSYAWDQLCYFLNPWEQGEIVHPGIMAETQKFLHSVGVDLKLSELITSRKNSVFSNFIVAKKEYWNSWKILAEIFLHYCDNGENGLSHRTVEYRRRQRPMKVFIQERLPALILRDRKLSTAAVDVNSGFTAPYFVNSRENVEKLLACDTIKNKIIENGINQKLIVELINARKCVLFK